MIARFIKRFKAAYIRMIARNISAFCEMQTKQPPRRVKNRAQHGFQFKMRLQRGAIETVLRLPRTFRPIAPIPGLDHAMMAGGAGEFFKLGLFNRDTTLGGFPTGAEQCLSRVG